MAEEFLISNYYNLWSVLISTAILSFLIILKILGDYYKTSRPTHLKYPPSIPSLPFVGSVPFFPDLHNIHLFFTEKKKTLGNVFTCRIATGLAVVLNDRQSIDEALIKRADDFSDRGSLITNKTVFNVKLKGYVDRVYDADYKMLQKRLLTSMRELGMGLPKMETNIIQEIEEFVQLIKERRDEAFDPGDLIQMCGLNVIYRLIFGEKISQTDATLTDLYAKVFCYINNDKVVVHKFPLLRFLPFYRNCIRTAFRAQREEIQFYEGKLEECLSGKYNREPGLLKLLVEKEGPGYDKENLLMTLKNVVHGSMEAPAPTMLWALYLITNDKVLQRKLQQEVDSVVPNDRLPSMRDLENMPLLEATLLEVMRYKTASPMALQHQTARDTQVSGFFVPRGTLVIPNVYAVHMDPDVWGDPEVFRPGRFLDETGGNVIGKKRIIPFSVGRRSCLGEGIARQEMPLMLASLVQNFDLLPPEGHSEICLGGNTETRLVTKPYPFKMRFVSRQK